MSKSIVITSNEAESLTDFIQLNLIDVIQITQFGENNMLGKPKFNYGDVVRFELVLEKDSVITCIGTIEIIDKYGTFEQNKEVSYDIMVDNFNVGNEPVFVKHIIESKLTLVKRNEDFAEMGLDPTWRFDSTRKY